MNTLYQITEFGARFSLPDSKESEVEAVRAELEMLCAEGKALSAEDGYLVKHETAASFDREERELLGLPRVYPYVISIRTTGSIGSPSFKYVLSYLKSLRGNDLFVNPRIVGAFIQLNTVGGGLTYLFNEDQYRLVRLVQDFNRRLADTSMVEQANIALYNSAKVQEYSRSSRVLLDDFLKKRKIVTADKLSIKIEDNGDGSYSVLPVLLHKTEKGYKADFTSPFDAVYKKQRSVSRNFLGQDNTNYVFSKEQSKALQDIRHYDHISQESAAQIAAAPGSVFDSDAFCFDMDLFSDRVSGIGEFIHKHVPYVRQSDGSWLPEEGTSPAGIREGTEIYGGDELEINRENVVNLYDKLQNAKVEDMAVLEDQGQLYHITPQLEARINSAYKKFSHPNIPVTEKGGKEKPGKESSLLVKDNLDELTYRAETRIHSLSGNFDPSAGLKENIRLFPHQKQGIEWMMKAWQTGHKGVLLADDMGLGKTLQAYGFIAALKEMTQEKKSSVLVVAPVTLLENWKNEFHKFVKDGLFDGIEELHGSNLRKYKTKSISVNQVKKNASGKKIIIPGAGLKPIKLLNLESLRYNKIVLTTYDTVVQYQLALGQIEWSVMILDEAQNIKNPTIQRSLAVKGMNYDFAIAMTGTPIENTWVDLWSIMDFVEPGKLKGLSEFSKTYITPVHKAKGNVKTIKAIGGQLRTALQPLFLRRMKDAIADELPHKDVNPKTIYMPAGQMEAYDEIVRQAKNAKDHKSILATIAALRDVSLCPYLSSYSDSAFLSMRYQDFFAMSARLTGTFQELVSVASKDEKVLIFVESKKLQKILRIMIMRAFAGRKLDIPLPINGEMNSTIRQRIVDEFNNAPGFQVLILSPLAAGVGLTITGANHVIHLSRCWNPAKEDQATDRVYRIGQQKDVTVYIPLAVNKHFPGDSFDEKLDELLEFKRSLSKSALFPVGDSMEDGFRLYNDMMGTPQKKGIERPALGNWTISDMAYLNGYQFEQVIADLYGRMDGYEAVRTPDSNDGGADVVVTSTDSQRENLLIQCKQTASGNNMDDEGVKEIVTACSGYQDFYNRPFHCVVITNAPAFTKGAQEKAASNHVTLISYEGLKTMLTKYPVPRI